VVLLVTFYSLSIISFAIFLRRANSFPLGSALANKPGRLAGI